MGTAQVTFVEEQVRSSEVTGTGNEREINSRVLYPYFPRFSGTPLDSRYE
jgi:hypothetical protein